VSKSWTVLPGPGNVGRSGEGQDCTGPTLTGRAGQGVHLPDCGGTARLRAVPNTAASLVTAGAAVTRALGDGRRNRVDQPGADQHDDRYCHDQAVDHER